MATERSSGRASSSDRSPTEPYELVFFIGAGFTKAIADGAPTGNDFLSKAFEPQWSIAKDDRVLELKEFLEFAYHPLGGQVPFPRIEDALSLLDFCIRNKAPLSSRYDVDSLRRLKGITVFLISQMIRESIEPRSRGSKLELSRQFVQKVLACGRKVRVISTNYDIILDNALLSLARSCNYGIRLRSNINIPAEPGMRPYANGDTWSFQDNFSPYAEDKINQGRIPLLKLHGSLNWVYCPKCDEIDITIGHKGASELLRDRTDVVCVNPYCTSNYEPLLVSPTMLKVYSTRALKELWRLCEEAVASAENLIFIGYSLPEADYLIRAMLIRGLAKNTKREDLTVMVIDRERKTSEERRVSAELEGRYASLLGERARIERIGLEGLLANFDGVLGL